MILKINLKKDIKIQFLEKNDQINLFLQNNAIKAKMILKIKFKNDIKI